MRVSRCACASLAAWYSAFSFRSPHSRAVLICAAICSRPVLSSCSSSARRASSPWAVIAFSVKAVPLLAGAETLSTHRGAVCGRLHDRQPEERRGRRGAQLRPFAGPGSRMKIGDDFVDLRPLDAVRVAPGTWRGTEAGLDGLEVIAFGARCGMAPDENDGEIEMGWWSD